MSDIAFSVLVGNGYDDIIFKTIMLKGDKGNSIASIEKTSTSGLVDTYTITLSDGTIGGTFTVTNGNDINIDDSVVSASKTWSSSKLSEMIGEGIDDEDSSSDKLWSSAKIEDEIMAQLSKLPNTNELDNVVIALFPDGADNVPVSDLIVDINAVQDGTGDASPTNVRAIHGWDTLNLVKCGTNVWDEEWELGIIDDTTGNNSPNSSLIRSKNYIIAKPNTEYYCNLSGKNAHVFCYDFNKNYLGYIDRTGNGIITTLPNTTYIRFRLNTAYGTTYNNDISINYPSADEDYHAYVGGVDTIDLSQEVYGGTLDVSTGLLTITHKKYAFDGTEDGWKKSGTYDGSFYINTGDAHIKDESDICSHAIFTQSFGEYVYGKFALDGNNNPNLNIFVQETGIDLPTFKSWLATQYANGTPLTAVLRLANNVTIQLTPTQVRTLLRQNQIYADTGNINKIVYFKTGSETVARMIEAYLRGE